MSSDCFFFVEYPTFPMNSSADDFIPERLALRTGAFYVVTTIDGQELDVFRVLNRYERTRPWIREEYSAILKDKFSFTGLETHPEFYDYKKEMFTWHESVPVSGQSVPSCTYESGGGLSRMGPPPGLETVVDEGCMSCS